MQQQQSEGTQSTAERDGQSGKQIHFSKIIFRASDNLIDNDT